MNSSVSDDRNFRNSSIGNNSRTLLNNGYGGYQGFNYENRTIISSPEYHGNSNSDYPKIPIPYINKGMSTKSMEKAREPGYFNSDNGNNNSNSDNIQKRYSQYKSFSPSATEVSMPNGIVYTVKEDQYEKNINSSSPSDYPSNFIKKGNEDQFITPRIQLNVNLSNAEENDLSDTRKFDYRTKTLSPKEEILRNRNSNHNSDSHLHENDQSYYRERKNSRNRRSRHKSSKYNRDSETESSDDEDDYLYDSDMSKSSSKDRRRNKQKEQKMILKLLMDDYMKRKEKEKLEEENKAKYDQQNKQNNTASGPGFQIPASEPVEQKSKIPNYELLSEIDKEKIKEKFRNNYNMLVVKYPKWKIEIPDFGILPLKLIHERYEQVVKTICIYQTAMKWKVYLVLIFALIEWYGYHKKEYVFLNGLLKAQIKTIHKFDIYLIEFAEKFYSDDAGEEYPLWLRSLGTFITGVVSFCSINGAVKVFGKNATPPDFVFEQIDKFVSPPEGTAKLHSDGISDVPEPPSGWQDPNSLIGMIGQFFSGIGGNKNTESNKEQTSEPQPQKARPVDDFDEAEL